MFPFETSQDSLPWSAPLDDTNTLVPIPDDKNSLSDAISSTKLDSSPIEHDSEELIFYEQNEETPCINNEGSSSIDDGTDNRDIADNWDWSAVGHHNDVPSSQIQFIGEENQIIEQQTNQILPFLELLKSFTGASQFELSKSHSYGTIDSQLIAHLGRPLSTRHALHQAVAEHDYITVILLLKSRHREMINERDPLGRTPLHIALLSCDLIAVQLLLSLPILPCITDVLDIDDEYVSVPEDLVIDDVEFPDLWLPFGQLPTMHLPLSGAGHPGVTYTIGSIYTLLLGYANLARELMEHHSVETINPTGVFAEACGWAPRFVPSSTSADPHLNISNHPSPTLEYTCNLPPRRSGIEKFLEFLETRLYSSITKQPELYWSVDASDGLGSSALHRACSIGRAELVELLLTAGANPLLKDINGHLPVHRAIDSGDETTFTLLLRRGGAVVNGHASESGCDPWSEETSMVALFKRCILRGAWRCLGRLVTDSVYSQFPISETDFDSLVVFAHLCGYDDEFSDAFKTAVDGSIPIEDGPYRKQEHHFLQGSLISVKIFTHTNCFHHLPFPLDGDPNAIKKYKLYFKYPENPSRLHCLISKPYGVLRSTVFQRVQWDIDALPVSMADILRVHEWSYIEPILTKLSQYVHSDTTEHINGSSIISHPMSGIEELDGDTPFTSGSWDAACAAAGVGIAAVNAVCKGECRAAFCVIRPPGHHVGTFGPCQPFGEDSIWESDTKEEDSINGSQGFCLLNNIAIAAGYARYHFAHKGIQRIGIVDFDIHHGNGTEQIIMNLKPRKRQLTMSGFRKGDLDLRVHYSSQFWKPWLNASDSDDVCFISMHGFGDRFYPSTGGVEEYVRHQNIHNVPLPRGLTQEEFRTLFKTRVIKVLAEFKPDIIFISAGFDGHQYDLVSESFGVCSEWDFEWMTRLLVAVANDCCQGRIVSLLEGGYNSKAGALSPLAQSVSHHVKALLQTSPSLSLSGCQMLDLGINGRKRSGVISETVDTSQVIDTTHLETVSSVGFSEIHEYPKRRKRAAAVRAMEHIINEQAMTQQTLLEKK